MLILKQQQMKPKQHQKSKQQTKQLKITPMHLKQKAIKQLLHHQILKRQLHKNKKLQAVILIHKPKHKHKLHNHLDLAQARGDT